MQGMVKTVGYGLGLGLIVAGILAACSPTDEAAVGEAQTEAAPAEAPLVADVDDTMDLNAVIVLYSSGEDLNRYLIAQCEPVPENVDAFRAACIARMRTMILPDGQTVAELIDGSTWATTWSMIPSPDGSTGTILQARISIASR